MGYMMERERKRDMDQELHLFPIDPASQISRLNEFKKEEEGPDFLPGESSGCFALPWWGGSGLCVPSRKSIRKVDG